MLLQKKDFWKCWNLFPCDGRWRRSVAGEVPRNDEAAGRTALPAPSLEHVRNAFGTCSLAERLAICAVSRTTAAVLDAQFILLVICEVFWTCVTITNIHIGDFLHSITILLKNAFCRCFGNLQNVVWETLVYVIRLKYVDKASGVRDGLE